MEGGEPMARKDVLQIRCSEQEKEKWRDHAASQGLELSAWIRYVLDKASRTPTTVMTIPGSTDYEGS